MRAYRVLVVEDDRVLRRFFVAVLQGAGYEVWQAEDVSSARARVQDSGLPDLMVLDLVLPVRGGEELYREVRALPGGDCLPVLAISGSMERLLELQAGSSGVLECLMKPVDSETLLTSVRQLLPRESQSPGQGRSLLLAEDDPAQSRLIALHLEALGFRVIRAADGLEALEMLRDFHPDVVLTDVLMPGLDGLQLCHAIRSDAELASLPVVLATSWQVDEFDGDLAANAGATRLVSRAAGLEPVIEAVLACLERSGPPRMADLPSDYQPRLIRRLERQAALNRALARRSTQLSAALDVLSNLSRSLCAVPDLESGLREVLGRLVVDTPFQEAAVYLLGNGAECLRSHRGILPGALNPTLLNAREPRTVEFQGRRTHLCPLTGEAEPVGVLALVEQSGAQGDEAESLARVVAGQLGQGIELGRTMGLLAAARERFRQMADNIHEFFWLADASFTQMLYASPACERLWGRRCDSLYEQPRSLLQGVHPEDRDRWTQRMTRAAAGVETEQEYRVEWPDGSLRWIWGRSFPIRNSEGAVYRICGVESDITERRSLELQLRQSQKMEALGRLAAGVAHDFNNLLTAIGGFSDLAVLALPEDDPLVEDLREIQRATERAAGLTRQLLTFSRRQAHRPLIFDLNERLVDSHRMLSRLLGEDVELRIDLSSERAPVLMDPNELGQVILNLAVNARDAMPRGGLLDLKTRVTDDEVTLTVTDTGSGMDEEVRTRLFEPFFTTKAAGTGLGLATAFGIVQAAGGTIHVSSQPGEGATFQVCLPLARGPVDPCAEAEDREARPRGWETILLVDDDDLVRRVTRVSLSRAGYTVMEARDGAEALRLCRQHDRTVHLLLADVVLPSLSGPELAERLLADRPGMKVAYMSGYAETACDAPVLEKPFTPGSLLRRVRRLLDSD
ncbi:MAG: response regulator [Candidatus Eremiobacterota bacterium]